MFTGLKFENSFLSVFFLYQEEQLEQLWLNQGEKIPSLLEFIDLFIL